MKPSIWLLPLLCALLAPACGNSSSGGHSDAAAQETASGTTGDPGEEVSCDAFCTHLTQCAEEGPDDDECQQMCKNGGVKAGQRACLVALPCEEVTTESFEACLATGDEVQPPCAEVCAHVFNCKEVPNDRQDECLSACYSDFSAGARQCLLDLACEDFTQSAESDCISQHADHSDPRGAQCQTFCQQFLECQGEPDGDQAGCVLECRSEFSAEELACLLETPCSELQGKSNPCE